MTIVSDRTLFNELFVNGSPDFTESFEDPAGFGDVNQDTYTGNGGVQVKVTGNPTTSVSGVATQTGFKYSLNNTNRFYLFQENDYADTFKSLNSLESFLAGQTPANKFSATNSEEANQTITDGERVLVYRDNGANRLAEIIFKPEQQINAFGFDILTDNNTIVTIASGGGSESFLLTGFRQGGSSRFAGFQLSQGFIEKVTIDVAPDKKQFVHLDNLAFGSLVPVPTPALLPGLIGMGVATYRRRQDG